MGRLMRCLAISAVTVGLCSAPAAAGVPELVEPAKLFPEVRVALVVGNQDYSESVDNPYGVADLPNALNDSRDIRDLLASLGFRVVYGENLDKRQMERAMAQFAEVARGSEVAITYFSGHGATFGDTPYLVPVDAEFKSLESVVYELVRTEDFISELRRAAGVRIALIDACRDNKAEQELKRRSGGAEMRGGFLRRGDWRELNTRRV